MNAIERAMTRLSNLALRCEDHHEPESAIKAEVEEESLYLLRLAAIDAEERRFRQLQRDGRRAVRYGCE